MNRTPYIILPLLHPFKPAALWVGAAAVLSGCLIASNLAQAAKPAPAPEPAPVAHEVTVASHPGGLIDHSALSNISLLPEPDASLLHSDPNAYVPVTYFPVNHRR